MPLRCLVFCLFFCLLMLPFSAQAALHKCADASGKVRYSDRPCENAEQAETRPIDAAKAAMGLQKHASDLPGVHPSWIETPAHLIDPARCLGHRCQCGDWQYVKHDRAEYRLFGAMRALPDAWDHYLRLADADREARLRGERPPDATSLREAACVVRVEQELLVELFPLIVPPLMSDRLRAEARKEAAERPCPQPDGQTVRPNDPRWEQFRECQRQSRQSRSSAETTLRRTHNEQVSLQSVLPPLREPRPTIAR